MAEFTQARYGPEKSIYSPAFLSLIYDSLVLGFNFGVAWGCPTKEVQLPFFSEHFSKNHLDVGVATGFFPAAALSRPYRSQETQSLTLMDFNSNSLQASEKRVLSCTTDTSVRCFEVDVTEALPKQVDTQNTKFDSISMLNLIHCIPPGPNKLLAFSTFKDILADDGVLVGCTLLGNKYATGWFSYLWLALHNRMKVLHNWDDNREHMEAALKNEFEEVETWLVGMVLLFRAQKPRRT